MNWQAGREPEFSAKAEREELVRLDAFKNLISLVQEETQKPVAMAISSRPSGDSFHVKCYFKSFTSVIGFGDRITEKLSPKQLISRYALRAYVWPTKSAACQREINVHIDQVGKRVSRVNSFSMENASWYEEAIEETIAAIPGAVKRLEDMQQIAIEYLATGELRRKKKAYLKKKHGKRVKKELTEALKVGLERDDIVDLLDEVIVQTVMES
jgi:hypothetical protein